METCHYYLAKSDAGPEKKKKKKRKEHINEFNFWIFDNFSGLNLTNICLSRQHRAIYASVSYQYLGNLRRYWKVVVSVSGFSISGNFVLKMLYFTLPYYLRSLL